MMIENIKILSVYGMEDDRFVGIICVVALVDAKLAKFHGWPEHNESLGILLPCETSPVF